MQNIQKKMQTLEKPLNFTNIDPVSVIIIKLSQINTNIYKNFINYSTASQNLLKLFIPKLLTISIFFYVLVPSFNIYNKFILLCKI